MRQLTLGIVATLALTCQLPAEEAAKAPAAEGAKPATSSKVVSPQGPAAAAMNPVIVHGVATPAAAALPAAPQRTFEEGQKVDLAGALYSTRDGRIVLKTEAGEIFVLLENQNLWRMEQRAAFGEREFRVRGQVSKYQERYYFAVSRILETAVKLKDKKESSENEKPIWERLMFWKNS